jgi:hypothetical protein
VNRGNEKWGDAHGWDVYVPPTPISLPSQKKLLTNFKLFIVAKINFEKTGAN